MWQQSWRLDMTCETGLRLPAVRLDSDSLLWDWTLTPCCETGLRLPAGRLDSDSLLGDWTLTPCWETGLWLPAGRLFWTWPTWDLTAWRLGSLSLETESKDVVTFHKGCFKRSVYHIITDIVSLLHNYSKKTMLTNMSLIHTHNNNNNKLSETRG